MLIPNRLRPAVLALALVLAASAAAQTTGWKTYTYADDGFSVSFPSDPQVSSQDVPVATTSYKLKTYLVDVGQSGMMIGICQFGSLVAGKNPDDLLQGGKNGALQETKTHLVSEKKITLGSAPGLEFDAENESLHAKVRIYLAGTTLYEVIEAYPLGAPFEHASDFLESFRILPATPATPAAPQ